VLKADAKVLVQGTILGQPVNLALRAGPIEDGGLVSCVTHTLTTAVPVAGCLLSQLLPTINLDVPLNLVLGSDNTGCSGLLPGLGGECAPAQALPAACCPGCSMTACFACVSWAASTASTVWLCPPSSGRSSLEGPVLLS
jgi:hypothetical protein